MIAFYVLGFGPVLVWNNNSDKKFCKSNVNLMKILGMWFLFKETGKILGLVDNILILEFLDWKQFELSFLVNGKSDGKIIAWY